MGRLDLDMQQKSYFDILICPIFYMTHHIMRRKAEFNWHCRLQLCTQLCRDSSHQLRLQIFVHFLFNSVWVAISYYYFTILSFKIWTGISWEWTPSLVPDNNNEDMNVKEHVKDDLNSCIFSSDPKHHNGRKPWRTV